MSAAPYREGLRYEYDVGHVGYGCTNMDYLHMDYLRKGNQACKDYLGEMANAGWRLVAVTEGREAWTFFWERLR